MKHEPVKNHAERKRILSLIEQCEKEQTMNKFIDVNFINSIIGCALEKVKDEVSPAYYRGARDVLDHINKMAEYKTEPQYDFGEYADRLWKIAYERGKREALAKDEPQTYITEDRDTQILDAWQVHHRSTTSVEDEPQTEMPRCSVNGTPYDECGFCEYFNCDTCKCEADVPRTERR